MPTAALRLLCGVVVPAAMLCAEPLPRVAFPSGDPRRILTRFSQENVSHYDIFLLGEGEEELYVGARDRVLALAVGAPGTIHAKASITWGPTAEKTSECAFKKKSQETECFNFIRVLVALNQTHLYVCGTYAFSPACTYIHLENFTLVSSGKSQPFLDGKGQCPFDPQHTYTALLVDGELYAGTMNNFQGNEPIISRSLGSRTLLKTDAFLRWLSADAAFVASFSIPNDDKVYFFFEETADEFDFFERLLVPRVARVCKSDVGGDKVLQKKWTTFLKAQLVCSQPGRFPFNVIHHAFALPRRDGSGGADFYAVFTSQWQAGRAGSAAVCVYSQEALEEVFEGKYKELNKESSRWTVYSGPNISPRPGSCSMGPSSDKALTFMKDHFLMDGKVAPTQGRPLLVKTDVKYTRIAVDETRGVSGAVYRVMFLATEEGFLHKAVELPAGPHIVESIQLFGTPEPVKNLLLAPGKGILYIGYSGGILQVPLANCSQHRSCAECVLARDPYCAWHITRSSCQPARAASGDKSGWLQDVEEGSPATMCHRGRSLAMPHTHGVHEGPPVETWFLSPRAQPLAQRRGAPGVPPPLGFGHLQLAAAGGLGGLGAAPQPHAGGHRAARHRRHLHLPGHRERLHLARGSLPPTGPPRGDPPRRTGPGGAVLGHPGRPRRPPFLLAPICHRHRAAGRDPGGRRRLGPRRLLRAAEGQEQGAGVQRAP
ncbi:semaphorin-4A isoform 2-T2 [Mergus octosetaceus]